jgi:hypothetical protein
VREGAQPADTSTRITICRPTAYTDAGSACGLTVVMSDYLAA